MDILNLAYPNSLDREKKHIEAFRAQIEGNLPKSSELYDRITVQYPRGSVIPLMSLHSQDVLCDNYICIDCHSGNFITITFCFLNDCPNRRFDSKPLLRARQREGVGVRLR